MSTAKTSLNDRIHCISMSVYDCLPFQMISALLTDLKQFGSQYPFSGREHLKSKSHLILHGYLLLIRLPTNPCHVSNDVSCYWERTCRKQKCQQTTPETGLKQKIELYLSCVSQIYHSSFYQCVESCIKKSLTRTTVIIVDEGNFPNYNLNTSQYKLYAEILMLLSVCAL